ncbi:type II secretion system protein N [Sphingomonas sp. H39-1-10]|uniref:type II secretion system protein N n=1 Tax=Sphingomonas pollutisoli TaxID=3030829 RepID=UPI0023B8BF66|nr:type II secretion system protein N [Sphingomonas pollutisoli]MDF0489527.1 type II secretion system protein N [Sphingomonas pollutisoli]
MRLVLDPRARALLRRLPRVTVYSAAELALIAVLAVQCARLAWAVVTPVAPLGDWRPAGVSVPGAPGDVLRGFDPFFRLSGSDAQPATVTSLQLTLFGTRIDGAMGGGSAIIAGPDGVQKSIAVGQELAPGATLKAVAFDHVTIDRGGAVEDLFLAQGDAGAAPPPAPPPPSASLLAPGAPAAGLTLSQLRAETGIIPRVDGGRVSGLVVRPQGGATAFRQAGLRDGDVVTAINGRPVGGAGDLERLGGQFAGGGTLSVTVERGEQTLPLAITIAGP